MKKTLMVIIVLGMLFSYNISFGDIYKYVDEEGKIHLTNVPRNPNVKYTLIFKEKPITPESVLGKNLLKWVEYARTNDGNVFLYNKKNITKSGKKYIVKVWDVSVYSVEGREDIIKRLRNIGVSTYGWGIISHQVSLSQINCNNKRSQTLHITFYDEDGKVLYSNDGESKWTYIVPDSIGDTLRNKVCK